MKFFCEIMSCYLRILCYYYSIDFLLMIDPHWSYLIDFLPLARAPIFSGYRKKIFSSLYETQFHFSDTVKPAEN